MATIRGAVLASGNGTKLQSLLDSIFFGEIPDLKLLAVISSDPNAYALVRAKNAGLETIVVEPGMFPNSASYDMAIRNKIKDLDIDDNAFKNIEAIIQSMTPKERSNPEILNTSRRNRIAKGSGTNIQEVNRLIKQFEQTRKMMRMVTGAGMRGMMGQMRNMKNMQGAPGMPKL